MPKYLEQREGFTDSFADWENKVRGPYPFQMTHVHYMRRAHTDYDNLPWLREAMQNPVFINKDDAKAKGIEDGDVILVHNDNGSFIRPASVTRTVMPGVVLVPHGAAARIDDETGIDIAGADNILTGSCDSTSSGLNGWNTTLVDYEKYTGSIELEQIANGRSRSRSRNRRGASHGTDGILLRCGQLHRLPYVPRSMQGRQPA